MKMVAMMRRRDEGSPRTASLEYALSLKTSEVGTEVPEVTSEKL
jgi:hypothetical protein